MVVHDPLGSYRLTLPSWWSANALCKSPARARGRLDFDLEFQTEALGSVTGRKPRAALAGACTACQMAMGPRASVPCPLVLSLPYAALG